MIYNAWNFLLLLLSYHLYELFFWHILSLTLSTLKSKINNLYCDLLKNWHLIKYTKITLHPISICNKLFYHLTLYIIFISVFEETSFFLVSKNKHFMMHNKLPTRDGVQKNNINDMAELMILFFTKSTEIIEVMLIKGRFDIHRNSKYLSLIYLLFLHYMI